MEIEIEIYETPNGKRPFERWFKEIQEIRCRAQVRFRLERLKVGNFGDCKTIGEGVQELRIHYGPGFRIYYSKIGNTIILLLCGGEKKSQTTDINRAKEYLKEYQSREKDYGKK